MSEFTDSATTADGRGPERSAAVEGSGDGPGERFDSAPAPASPPSETLRQAMEQALADVRISGAGMVTPREE